MRCCAGTLVKKRSQLTHVLALSTIDVSRTKPQYEGSSESFTCRCVVGVGAMMILLRGLRDS